MLVLSRLQVLWIVIHLLRDLRSGPEVITNKPRFKNSYPIKSNLAVIVSLDFVK